jgi:hypothetical protein
MMANNSKHMHSWTSVQKQQQRPQQQLDSSATARRTINRALAMPLHNRPTMHLKQCKEHIILLHSMSLPR